MSISLNPLAGGLDVVLWQAIGRGSPIPGLKIRKEVGLPSPQTARSPCGPRKVHGP